MTEEEMTRRMQQVAFAVSCLMLVFAVGEFLVNAELGLRIFEFADETEKLVAARMLKHGWDLYRDVFAHHGPLPYMIAHGYAVTVSESDFSYIRVAQILLAMVAGLAVASSPVLKTLTTRMWAAALYLLLVSSIWISQSIHMFLNDAIAGFLLAIVVCQFIAPLLLNEQPSRAGTFCSGVAICLAFFCAYTYGVSASLFALSALPLLLRSPDKVNLTVGFLLGVLLTALGVASWLATFGDIPGFFLYHIYFNQAVYSKFIDFSLLDVLKNFIPAFEAGRGVHALGLFALVGWVCILLYCQRRTGSRTAYPAKVASTICLALGVAFTNPRAAAYWHDSAFLIVNISLFALAGARVLEGMRSSYRWTTVSMVTMSIGIIMASQVTAKVPSPFSGNKYVSSTVEMKPDTGPVYEFVRSITATDDDLLALVFNPVIYIKADRIPASGNYYYLPWQAAYNKDPAGNHQINLCADIEERKPAVIWFLNWRVWNKYSIEMYEPCILQLLIESYLPLSFASPWLVRKDVMPGSKVPEGIGDLPQDAIAALKADVARGPGTSSPIIMAPSHAERQAPLRRIGLMLSDVGKRRIGQAELHLTGPNGAEFVRRFESEALLDNAYNYFEVAPGHYASGEILSITGAGFRTWQSQLGASYTCAIYEYTDGSQVFTPACPIM